MRYLINATVDEWVVMIRQHFWCTLTRRTMWLAHFARSAKSTKVKNVVASFAQRLFSVYLDVGDGSGSCVAWRSGCTRLDKGYWDLLISRVWHTATRHPLWQERLLADASQANFHPITHTQYYVHTFIFQHYYYGVCRPIIISCVHYFTRKMY